MNTTIAATLISVLGAGLFGGIYGLLFHIMRSTGSKLDHLTTAVHGLETKSTGEIKDLEVRFTGEIKDLGVRFTGEIKDLGVRFTGEIKDLEVRLTDKFTGELKAQGERIDRVHDVLRDHTGRLSRIEAKLGIDPPAEAA